MKLSIAKSLPLLFLVGACAEGVQVKQPPVSVTLKNEAFSTRVVGYTEPVIRTFIPQEVSEDKGQHYQSGADPKPTGIKRTEVSGATCSIDSAEFSAQFQTPAIVRLPKFHGEPTPARIACKTPELSTRHTQTATLDGVVIGGASVAGLVAAAVTAGIAASKDNWSYGANNIPLWINLKD